MATWRCPVCDRIHADPSYATRGGCVTCAPADGSPGAPAVESDAMIPAPIVDASTRVLLTIGRRLMILAAILGILAGVVASLLSLGAGHPGLAFLQLVGSLAGGLITAAIAALVRVVLRLEESSRPMLASEPVVPSGR